MKNNLISVWAVTFLLALSGHPAQALNRTAFLTFKLLGEGAYNSPARTSVMVDGTKQWALELSDVAQDGKVYWLPDINKLLLDNATIETEKTVPIINGYDKTQIDILLKGSNTISGRGNLISAKGNIIIVADESDAGASLTLNTQMAAIMCGGNLALKNIQLECTTARYVLMCTGSLDNKPTLSMQNASANLKGTKSCIQGFRDIVTIGCGLPYNEYEDQRVYYDKKKGMLTHNERLCLEFPITNSETYIPINSVPLTWGWSSERTKPEEPGANGEGMVEESPTMDEPVVEEEPVAMEEPVMEEPVAEEPVAQEPAVDEKIYEVVEEYAHYGANSQAFLNYVKENMRYPHIAEDLGIQGRVLLRFVVEIDGTLSNIEVLRSPDNSLEKEALRLIQSAPDTWHPGKQRGKDVRSRLTVPIVFRLNK